MLFTRKPPIAAGTYYINYVDDEMILACNRSEFLGQIPQQFKQENEETFVLRISRDATESEMISFKSVLGFLVHAQDIEARFNEFITSSPSPGRKK
jgi:hypothetical protein